MKPNTLTTLLKTDAVANEFGGIALIAAGGWLAEPMGLATAWPLWITGTLLVVNGIGNWFVARDTSTRGLMALITVDLVFAVVVLALAISDPTNAETWLRWSMATVADFALAVGVAKIVGLRSFSTDATPAVS